MSKTSLSIKGMTCDHCKAAVERALGKVPGVVTVSVDRIAGSAELDIGDNDVPRENLIAAIEKAGFEAK